MPQLKIFDQDYGVLKCEHVPGYQKIYVVANRQKNMTAMALMEVRTKIQVFCDDTHTV